MKIALIYPPIEDFYTTRIRSIPLGLLYLAFFLQEHEVGLIDLRNSGRMRIVPPEEMVELERVYREDLSPFALYQGYYRFGLKSAEIREVLSEPFDLYAISSNFTTYAKEVVELIEILRSLHPDSVIVVGGYDATIRPEVYLSAGADFVVQGPGEMSFKRLVKSLETGGDYSTIPGLCYKKDCRVIRNEFMGNNVIWPSGLCADYSLPGLTRMSYEGRHHCMLVTGYGCPYRCRFCSIHALYRYQHYQRPVEEVLNELKIRIREGFRSIDIEDDHFGGSRTWLREFLKKVIPYTRRYNLLFHAMNGINVNLLDEEILILMKEAGFRSLGLALVSPSQKMGDLLNRPFRTDQLQILVQQAKSLGFSITVYLILGLPGDELGDILKGITLLAQMPVLLGPSIFYLTPDCELYRQVYSGKNHTYSIFQARSSSLWPMGELSRVQLATLFRLCRIINFIKELIDCEFSVESCIEEEDCLRVPETINSTRVKQVAGVPLVRRFLREGKIYGLERIGKRHYRLYEHTISPEVVAGFFALEPEICGLQRKKSLSLETILQLL